MKKILIFLLLAVLVAAASVLILFNGNTGNRSSSYAHTGTVEDVEVTVSFQIPGKVASVSFEEGETVQEGQIMAALDTLSLVQELSRARAARATAVSRLATARARTDYLRRSVQAQIKGAEANLHKLTTGLRPQEVETARQNVERAMAEAQRTEKEAQRVKTLYEDGVVPQVRWDNAKAAAQVAAAELLAARESLDMARIGARAEDIQAAGAALEAAEARLKEVQAAELESRSLESEIDLREAEVQLAAIRLGYATLRAPVSGVALTRAVEPGENVQAARPVSTIADLAEVKIRFYVPEEELGELRLNGLVRVVSDSAPQRPVQGRISYISHRAEFTPKSIMTRDERTKLVFMVKALVPNTDQSLKPGMPVDVFLER